MTSNPLVLAFSLFISIPILFLLGRSLFPPPLSVPFSPSDELDDISLFERAASLSQHNPSFFSRLSSKGGSPKVAFLFLTNTDLHFAPLWEKFFKSGRHLYNIYVHADPYVNVTRPNGVFQSKFIKHARRTFRASPTLVSAMRRLLATAIIDDRENVFFAILSQYCIPLHSFSYVYDSLVISKTFDLSFNSSDLDSSSVPYGVGVAYRSFIEILSKEPWLWKRYVARGRYSMLPEVPFENFRVGSQFFVLTRRHALMVVRDRKLWMKFRLSCYRDDYCYPEEHYFPTLLSMEDPDQCTQYTLTNVNWTGSSNGHPYMYQPLEISPWLIEELRKSNYSSSYLFARKFSPDCLAPLMKIADSAIFQD